MSFALKTYPLHSKPAFQASKWLELRFLIDTEEMKDLMTTVSPFDIYLANNVSSQGEGHVTHASFLHCYHDYIEALKQGKVPDNKSYRALFSSSWTVASDHLYALTVGENQQLIRIEKPVVQLQSHCMDFSTADTTFRSMVYGPSNILWGIQCSYPQIFQNHVTHTIDKVTEGHDFPNTSLFRAIQQWLRQHTIPTPFIVENNGEELTINSPMRLGKKCLSWINHHPQLISRKIKVKNKLTH